MEDGLISLLVIGAIALIAVSIGSQVGEARERDRAVEAGAAYYVADPTTGDVSFHYITEKEDE